MAWEARLEVAARVASRPTPPERGTCLPGVQADVWRPRQGGNQQTRRCRRHAADGAGPRDCARHRASTHRGGNRAQGGLGEEFGGGLGVVWAGEGRDFSGLWPSVLGPGVHKRLGLRPLCPKLPNPRPGLAPTPPGPSLKPAPQSSAASRPRPQSLAPYPETPPPADPVLRSQAPPQSMSRCPELPNLALSPHPGASRTCPQFHLALYPA